MQSYSTDSPLHLQSQSVNSLFVTQNVTIHVKINMVLSIPI